jgi:multidrug efflux system membrane fusion protein
MKRVLPFVLLACKLAGCNLAAPARKTPTAVRVRAVERSADGGGMRYSATINPASRVDLAFKLGGYVDSVTSVKGTDGRDRLLQEGDHVVLNEPLAALRKADYEQKQAEARASMGEAAAAKHQAQIEFTRSSRLVATGAIASAELDTARARLDAANARVATAKAHLDEAHTALTDSALRAPMAGVVLKRSVEVGALAAPGLVAFSIADTRTVKVVFGVADVELEGLQVGATQTISTEAYRGQTFTGHITRIAPAADARSRVFEVEVTIPNAEDQLKPGMIASLKVNAQSGGMPSVALPLTAIVRSPAHRDRFAVFVVTDDKGESTARLREVEVGDFLGNNIPIRSGLNEHDRVVVMGATLISDGEQVQVIP